MNILPVLRNFEKYSFFSIIVFFTFFASGCNRDPIPEILNLSNPIYENRVSHFVGPGGINHSFVVYKLEPDVAEQIEREGLAFFKSITPQIKYSSKGPPKPGGRVSPYWTSFSKWAPLPVAKDKKWIRRSYSVDSGTQPTFSDFFGDIRKIIDKENDRKFSKSINPEILAKFNEVLISNNGYYSYGYYRENCVMIVSPENGVAYFLFRD